MAVSMEAGTAVIFNLSPPPPPSSSPSPSSLPSLLRRKCHNKSIKRSSLFSGASFSTRTSTLLRIRNNVSQPSHEGDFYGSSNNANVAPTSALSFVKGLVDSTLSNLLPLSLLIGVTLGFNSPALGCLLQKYSFSKFITCYLFFLSGLKSQDGDFKEVVDAWPALLYGLASILLVCPLLSKLILKIQMAPQEFVTGIAILSCMPTTMNGGIALTQLVGGNFALALALTVISILLGILTVPLWITKFFAEVAIPTGKLFRSLILTLLIPLVCGKVLRKMSPGVARYVEQNARVFSISTSILLGFFPWMQVSNARELLLLVKPHIFVGAIFLALTAHVSFLVLNATLVRCLSVGPSSWKSIFEKEENRRALTLVCSQRSVLIATAVVEQLGGVLGQSGLLLLPCVAGDVIQIIVDSLLVNFWLGKDESRGIVKKPA